MGNNISIGHKISIVNRYSQIYLMDALSDLNLHGSGQIRIVLKLSQHIKGISQEKLAQILIVDKATISRMIRPMINNGIVERTSNPADKRAYILKLTSDISEKIPEIQKRIQKWTNILSQDLSQEELDNFFNTLEKIFKNAENYIKG